MVARRSILITAAVLCHLLLAIALFTTELHAQEQAPESTNAPAAGPSAIPTTPPQATKQDGSESVPAVLKQNRQKQADTGEPVTISAREQEKRGDVYYLRGDVEIDFRAYKLRADEMTYDDSTGAATASGHVVLDGGPHDEHMTATHGTYNVDTDTGRFWDVVGTTGAKLRGRTVVLTSSSPFSFRGAIVDKEGRDKIIVHHGTVTSCTLPRPKWSFHANHVTVVAGEDAKIYHSSFWLWRFPVFYFPFFDHPVEHMGRKTGLLLPSIGQSSTRGTVAGEGVFWAINRSMDATLGAELFSKRGWSQHGNFRAWFNDSTFLLGRYYGVLDRGDPTTHQDQGGEEVRLNGGTRLSKNIRAVADIDYLSSYLFRQAFAESFTEAINSEVRSIGFLTDNWHGYSFNGTAGRYQNFQSTTPGDVITIVHAPSLESSTVDRALGHSHVYWGFDVSADGVSRREPGFVTANVVGRFDLYPHLSLPLLWHGWTLRPDITVRDTWYGDRLLPAGTFGQPGSQPVNRRALGTQFELRPPILERVFDSERLARSLKHTVEPRITYRDVTGVDNFVKILRFDLRDILSDTNEIEYALVQHLYTKPRPSKGCSAGASLPSEPATGASPAASAKARPAKKRPPKNCQGGSAREIVSWEVGQKYFFDPFFGGALVPGKRNVFTTTVDFTGIAFLTEPRRFSPVISRLRLQGPSTDAEWHLDYDTKRGRISSSYAVLNYRFLGNFSLGGAHAFLQTPGEIFASALQPTLPAPSKFNQFRVLLSYGHPNKRGFASAATIGYDANLNFLQYAAAQTTYNWDCCGVTFEYRRLALGAVRNENQFRFAFSLANVGTFGTLRKQERLF